MHKLYYYEGCPFCVRVRMILEAVGCDYSKQILQYDDKETTQRLANTNSCPILTLEDGSSIADSAEIINYLIKRYNFKLDPRTLPSVISEALGPVQDLFVNLFISRRLKMEIEEFKSKSAKEYFYKRWNMTPDDIEQEIAKTDQYVAIVDPCLKIITDALQSDHFVYNNFAMADVELFPALRSAACVKGLDFPARLQQYLDFYSNKFKILLLPRV